MSETLQQVLQRVPESVLRAELDRRTNHRAFHAVARAWAVSPSDLSHPSRQPHLCEARHSLAAILRQKYHLTYDAIAAHLHIHPSSPIKTIAGHPRRMESPAFRARHQKALRLLNS